MPSYNHIIFDGFNVSVKPTGFRRCFLFRCLPYLSGSRVELKISIDKPLNKPLSYDWNLARWDMNMNLAEKEVLKGDGKISYGTQGLFSKKLYINGKHTLHITFWYEGKEKAQEVMSEFNIQDKDISVTNILIGLIGAGIGAGLFALILKITELLRD